MTLGMTIGRSPRGEGPDRPRDRERGETRRERRTGRTLDQRQLHSWWEEGATPQGHGKGDGPGSGPDRAPIGESGTLGSKVGLYTHTETHDPSYNLNVIIDYYCNKYTLF